MKKRISCILLCGLMAASCVPASAAVSDVVFTIGGMRQLNDATAINIKGQNYLPMRAIFELLGGEVDWNQYKNEAMVKIDDTRIVIDANNMSATINGEPADIGAVRISGQMYIPVRLMGETLGYDVKWDSVTRTVDVRPADKDYVLYDEKATITENTRILTFEEAIELAKKRNSNLKNLSEAGEYIDETREDLGNTINALESARGLIDSALLDSTLQADDMLALKASLQENIETVVSLGRSIKNLDVQSSLTKVNEQMILDGIEITVLSQINAIKGTESQIALLEESIAVSDTVLQGTRLKNQLGYTSDVDLKKAELSQEETEKNLDLLKESLASQKEALNFTLGLDANADVYVENDVEVDDMSDFMLEPFIIKQTESAPSIKVLEGNVTIAEYTRRTTPALISESTLGVTNDLNTAQRALKDGKSNLEKNIRSAYHNIQQLALQDKQLKIAVEEAVTDYNSVVASYKAGMATETQVRQARLGVLSAEKSVEDNKLNYIMLVKTFEKPYLLG